MLDVVKNSMYLGLGIATVTKEKIESLVDELIEKGQLTKEEKSKTVTELLEKLEKDEKDFKEKIDAVVNEALHNSKPATEKELHELRGMILELQEKVNKI